MKSENNILIAFILNLFFSVLEFIGGVLTGSVAIISDSVHDFGDAISIAISLVLEKISKRKPNKKYTYGYVRYSVLGGVITTTILIVGSIFVIINAIKRIINPIEINYSGMIILAIIGFLINFIASYITARGESLNQKAVNIHMFEDTLGWVVVLIGAVIMKFSDISIIDPVMSIIVSLFILICALKNLKEILDLFLEKTPNNVDIDSLKEELLLIKGVKDIHHIHVWSIDGFNNFATLHVVSDEKNIKSVKNKIREVLKKYNIKHSTIESEDESCESKDCKF